MASTAIEVNKVGSNPKFRQTQAGVSLGKQLFTPGVTIAPTAITAGLKAAGINVPKGAQITADVAQIVMSGGMVASSLQAGQSFSSMVFPTAAVIGAAQDLMVQAGIMDPASPMAQILTLGTDVAMVVATGGVNVIADIKLVFDVINELNSAANTQQQANVALAGFIQARQAPQMNALSKNFAAYHNGDISFFELMGRVATESPDLFYNYFPDEDVFIPPQTLIVVANVSQDNILAGHLSASARQTIKTVLNTDPAVVKQEIFDQFIKYPLYPYMQMEQTYGKNFVRLMALFSTFPPYQNFINDNFSMFKMLKALNMTPSLLGENVFGRIVDSTIKEIQIQTSGTAIFQWTQADFADAQQTIAWNTKYKMWDDSGNLFSLLNNKDSFDRLKEWGNVDWSQFEGTPMPGQPTRTAFYLNISTIGKLIRNYWSALSLLKMVESDKYFRDISAEFGSYDFMGTSKQFQDAHQQIQLMSVGKRLNANAAQNIASFFGKSPSKMRRVGNAKTGNLSYFAPKG